MSPNREDTRLELSLAKRGGLREALRLLTPVYAGVVGARNSLYDAGRLRAHRAGVPVISVGNLSTGGTGKTPFVIWLVELLRSSDSKPGVLARGYGSAQGATLNDEGALLSERFRDLPQVQRGDRVAGAAELEELGEERSLRRHEARGPRR